MLAVVLISALCDSATAEEQYLEVGKLCAKARDPGACMKSYGFQCHRGRVPDRSTKAFRLGCNLSLGDGRYHFVQLLYDERGANVETEHTYWPEFAEVRRPENDSELALETYLRNEIRDYSSHSSGGGSLRSGAPMGFETGARRVDGRVAVRAVCGAVADTGVDDEISGQVRAECEIRLLRTVKLLSQKQASGPYRVAGASEFEWETRLARLVSGESALIVEGRYTFAEKHTPCRWISDCCSIEGHMYLDSCRVPTESELKDIDTCLAKVGMRPSKPFVGCLQDAGVKVGCEEQADGSQICY